MASELEYYCFSHCCVSGGSETLGLLLGCACNLMNSSALSLCLFHCCLVVGRVNGEQFPCCVISAVQTFKLRAQVCAAWEQERERERSAPALSRRCRWSGFNLFITFESCKYIYFRGGFKIYYYYSELRRRRRQLLKSNLTRFKVFSLSPARSHLPLSLARLAAPLSMNKVVEKEIKACCTKARSAREQPQKRRGAVWNERHRVLHEGVSIN